MEPVKQAVSMARMIGGRNVSPLGAKNARESLLYSHIGPKLRIGFWYRDQWAVRHVAVMAGVKCGGISDSDS